MQQAYRLLRVVAEAQTIRIVLTLSPNELMLRELYTACTTFTTEKSDGIKAVVLDFMPHTDTYGTGSESVAPGDIEQACAAVQAVPPPVLAVVRGSLSPTASALVQMADLTLVAHNAVLTIGNTGTYDDHTGHHFMGIRTGAHSHNGQSNGPENHIYTGSQALRLRFITWSVAANNIDAEMERILNMLREKSAVALRLAKIGVRLGGARPSNVHLGNAGTRLEALQQVNEFYLQQVMQTLDASEGLHAFLEKRKPQWKNR